MIYLTKIIGCVVLAIIFLAIPILLPMAIIYGWWVEIIIFLGCLTAIEFVGVLLLLFIEVDIITE